MLLPSFYFCIIIYSLFSHLLSLSEIVETRKVDMMLFHLLETSYYLVMAYCGRNLWQTRHFFSNTLLNKRQRGSTVQNSFKAKNWKQHNGRNKDKIMCSLVSRCVYPVWKEIAHNHKNACISLLLSCGGLSLSSENFLLNVWYPSFTMNTSRTTSKVGGLSDWASFRRMIIVGREAKANTSYSLDLFLTPENPHSFKLYFFCIGD